MSLLLKALKQAETAKGNSSGHADRAEADLELEPLAASAREREWVEPPATAAGGGWPAIEPAAAPAFRWPQPSLVPLTALLAALVAIGYGAYLYFALQPAAPVLPPPASPALVEPAAAAAPLAIEPAPTAVPPAAPPPSLPEAAAPASPAPPSRPAPSHARARSTTPAAAPPAAPPQFQPDVQSTVLERAYAAYQRGDLAEAQRLYAQAAARHRSVDALLGLAAIASVQNRDGDAQRLYREVLDLDPRNAAAQAALLDLVGNADNQATESRLKTLIERSPSPPLYLALGNLYADQARWHDAQAAYFEAWRGAPDNADYAYNLAVSLDQLRQYPAALTYYEKALASGGVHRFDRSQAEARVKQLKPDH